MRFKRKSSNILQSDVEAGVALLDAESNTYFLLNNSGAVIWAELQDARSLDEICEAVAKEFDVSSDDCKRDIEQMLDSMVLKGLVVADDETPA